MKFSVKTVAPFALALILSSPALAKKDDSSSSADASSSVGVQGMGVVDVDTAVAKSSAYTTAMSQMKVTYKANIDSVTAKKTSLESELKTKGEALDAALKAAGGKPTPALQSQYQAFQQRGQQAQQELQTAGQPLAIANAYVEAQISAKIGDALKAAMTKNGLKLLLAPNATVSYVPSMDVTDAVTTELNTLIPSVSIIPPTGWQPGQPLAGAAPTAGGR
jgi:Skp family chaperone for outer membrane proteins